jgi:hypothetical protein
MSDIENPYQSPETPVIPEKSQSTETVLTEKMLRYLKEASPWLRFIGIVGMIGCGLMAVAGLITAIVMAVSFGESDQSSVWVITLLVYIPVGILMFFPALYTYNFGAKIRKYLFSNLDEDLESAFKNNKSLWKFIGILSIINLSLIPLTIIIAIIGGIVAAVNIFNI